MLLLWLCCCAMCDEDVGDNLNVNMDAVPVQGRARFLHESAYRSCSIGVVAERYEDVLLPTAMKAGV